MSSLKIKYDFEFIWSGKGKDTLNHKDTVFNSYPRAKEVMMAEIWSLLSLTGFSGSDHSLLFGSKTCLLQLNTS